MTHHVHFRFPILCSVLLPLVAIFCLAPIRPARAGRLSSAQRRAARPAQRPTDTAPAATPEARFKGIWEPVSYPEDLRLEDVFFTTPNEGWAVGGANEMKGGVILHTNDGGDHWDVQYGDPQSAERSVRELRFLDMTHGWAVQRTGQASRLFHTTDGRNWISAGTIAEHHADYMFTSETNGVEVGGHEISQTQDGGRRWQQVFECATKIQSAGLTRKVTCELKRVQFLTPSLGYAVGFSHDVRGGIFLAKTSDGGATWSMVSATQVADQGNAEDLFFIDENTGYVRVGGADTGQVFKTTDGGQTWTGMATSPGIRMQFADPEVGWALHSNKVAFTTDGGQHWNSRQYPFPATTRAFSLPRRDRGYVVGDHGMIFRYRIVPEEYSNPKGMMPAPLLSGINSPLEVEVEQAAAQVQSLAAQAGLAVNAGEGGTPAATEGTPNAGAAPGGASGNAAAGAGAAAGGTATTTDTSAQKTAAATGLSDAAVNAPAFTQSVTQAESTVQSVASAAPQFANKYRSLNLIASSQAAIQLPGQAQELKESFAGLKQVKDGKLATAALTNIYSKVQNLMQTTKLVFLKK